MAQGFIPKTIWGMGIADRSLEGWVLNCTVRFIGAWDALEGTAANFAGLNLAEAKIRHKPFSLGRHFSQFLVNLSG